MIFCLGKWWHRSAEVGELRFLLTPVDGLVGMVTGGQSQWQDGVGYAYPASGVIIDASCAGMNFFLISSLLFAHLLFARCRGWWVVGLAPLLAWPLAVVANACRILSLLVLGAPPSGVPAGVWHEGWGAFIYLFSLVATSLLLSWYWPVREFIPPRKRRSGNAADYHPQPPGSIHQNLLL